MTGTTITGTITHTVRLGSGGYNGPLTITGTGDISPNIYGASGIVVPASFAAGNIVNQGQVSGAPGGQYVGNGGIGIDAAAPVAIRNAGMIDGGAGGYPASGDVGYFGGIGVDLCAGGSIVNSGTIVGGAGAYAYDHAGRGGRGVELHHGSLSNIGTIAGGAGGVSTAYFGNQGSGPNAIGGHGAIGVDLTGSNVNNAGLIIGGAGGDGYLAAQGGYGVTLDSGALTNTGIITGGLGGSSYGSGGIIAVDKGGAGGPSKVAPVGSGAGGDAVLLRLAMLTNTGTITGGAAGSDLQGLNTNGGSGVVIQDGTLVASGIISGGLGGSGTLGSQGSGGDGGAGVFVEGGVLIASGTIAGGAPGTGNGGVGDAGAAVEFIGQGTLVVDPGAIFNGLVIADASAFDTLMLAGTSAAALSGLGSQFTGFSTLMIDSNADWTLTGSNTLAATSNLLDAGHLRVTGSLLVAGVNMAGGLLSDAANGLIGVGAALGNTAGAVTVDSGASLTGFGAISSAMLVDNGAITASGGVLTLSAAVSGTGTATIHSGATLDARASLSGVAIVFDGASHLRLGTPNAVTGTISGFGAGDTIDIARVATSLSFAGGVLTLDRGSVVVAKLELVGNYTSASFSLTADGHGGTDISFAGEIHDSTSLASFSHAREPTFGNPDTRADIFGSHLFGPYVTNHDSWRVG